MAVAYSTIVNGGKVAAAALRPAGRRQRAASSSRLRTSRRSRARQASTRPGARRSWTACTPRPTTTGGTSTAVFDQGWPRDRFPIYGKTGTAERQPQRDQSWYVAYSYSERPERKPIVVATTVEQRRIRRRRGRAGHAPDPVQVVRRRTPKLVRGSSAPTDEHATTPDPRRRRRAAARARRSRIPGMALPIDLVLFLGGHRPRRRARWSRSTSATADDVTGQPDYYFNRQACSSPSAAS